MMNLTPCKKELRVLLIDDDETEFLLTQAILNQVEHSDFKYCLDWEPNGERAKERMIKNDYDLYLLDYHIGRWNGVQLLRDIQHRCENPIIMLTEHDQYEVDKEAMESGAWDFVLKRDLSSSVIERVFRYATQRKAELDQLKIQAMRDDLTRLCNRREFNLQLHNQIAAVQRHQHPLCLSLCDVDHFKTINDTYGHAAGDVALIQFSREIQDAVRSEDIVARFGGDEFAIIFPHADTSGALACTERIRHNVESMVIRSQGHRFKIQCSFGIALYQTGMNDLQLLNAADMALYQAKTMGRNQSFVRESDHPFPNSPSGTSH